MNKFRVVFAGAALLLMFSLSILGAQAAPPNAPAGPMTTDPGSAPYIDNAMHNLPANSSTWYRFEYAGDPAGATVTLVNGTNSGMGFKVFTTGQLPDWWTDNALGQGTPQQVNCNSGRPADYGGCSAADLTWVTHTREGATFYVLVANNTSGAMDYQLTATGPGVVQE